MLEEDRVGVVVLFDGPAQGGRDRGRFGGAVLVGDTAEVESGQRPDGAAEPLEVIGGADRVLPIQGRRCTAAGLGIDLDRMDDRRPECSLQPLDNRSRACVVVRVRVGQALLGDHGHIGPGVRVAPVTTDFAPDAIGEGNAAGLHHMGEEDGPHAVGLGRGRGAVNPSITLRP